MRWYIEENGDVSGPYETEALRESLANSSISPNSLVCMEGGQQWQPLNSFPQLFVQGARSFQRKSVNARRPDRAFVPQSNKRRATGFILGTVAILLFGVLGVAFVLTDTQDPSGTEKPKGSDRPGSTGVGTYAQEQVDAAWAEIVDIRGNEMMENSVRQLTESGSVAPVGTYSTIDESLQSAREQWAKEFMKTLRSIEDRLDRVSESSPQTFTPEELIETRKLLKQSKLMPAARRIELLDKIALAEYHLNRQ